MTRLVALGVIALAILAVTGIIVLAILSRTIPDVLPTIAVSSLTGLIGLLVPRSGDPLNRPDA